MYDESASREISDVIFVRDVRFNEITDPLANHRLYNRLNSDEAVEYDCCFEAVHRCEIAREKAADAFALMNFLLR